MGSIEALVGAMPKYEGTLQFISLAVYFIRQLAASVLRVQDGEVTLFPGDYDYYLDKSARDAAVLAGTVGSGNTNSESRSVGSKNSKERKRRETEERQAKYQLRQEWENRLCQIEELIRARESTPDR